MVESSDAFTSVALVIIAFVGGHFARPSSSTPVAPATAGASQQHDTTEATNELVALQLQTLSLCEKAFSKEAIWGLDLNLVLGGFILSLVCGWVLCSWWRVLSAVLWRAAPAAAARRSALTPEAWVFLADRGDALAVYTPSRRP